MNSPLKIIIFVLVMGTFAGALLVGVNIYTSPLIAKNEELKLKSSVLEVFEIPHDKTTAMQIFDRGVKILKRGEYTFYVGSDSSVAFEFHGPGLWGPISGIISFEKDLKTIRNLKILHQEETPGLGGRIAERDYLKQFKNKIFSPKLIFMPQGKALKSNEVDSITGATGSSKALEKLLNENIQQYLAAIKE